MKRNSFGTFAKSIIIVVCIMASKGFAVSPWDTPLDINLTRITNQDKGEGTDVQKLEDKCLELLKDHNSPEDKGKIYAKIALMYAGKGYSSPNDIRIAKTTEYCNKALENPLDLITTCEMYSRLSTSEIHPYIFSSETEFAKARKEAIVTCLKGLKLVLDNNAPTDLNQIQKTGVFAYMVNPNNPDYNRIVQEHQRQLELHNKGQFEEKLYILRRSLLDGCANIYAYKRPHDTNELENFAREILKGHDDAIDEIMSKVRERISKQNNK